MIQNSSKEWKPENLAKYIHYPLAGDNKYTRGVLGFHTGSINYPGAAVLGVEAAFRTGIGLVRFIGDEVVSQLVLNRRPETVLAKGSVDAWVLGSGQDQFTFRANTIVEPNLPVVLDGAAIAYSNYFTGLKIITPHVGELARLFLEHATPGVLPHIKKFNLHQLQQEIRNDPIFWGAIASKEYGTVVVLKGETTYVFSDDDTLETRNISISELPHQLSTAGTGDVLAGIIGALLASNIAKIGIREIRVEEVAASAVLLHKQAALVALNDSRIITALDIAAAVSLNATYSF